MHLTSKRSRHSKLLVGLILVMLGVIGYGGYAYWMLSRLQKEVDQWVMDHSADGWSVSHDAITAKLYFDHAGIRMSHLNLVHPNGQWSAETFALSRYFLDPGHVRMVISGANSVQIGKDAWRFAAFPLRIDLRLSANRDQIKSLQATASDVQVVNGTNQAMFAQALGLSLVPVDHTDQPTIHIIGTAAGLEFKNSPSEDSSPITMAEINGKIKGAIPTALPGTALESWNNAGGTVELERLAVEWPPIKIEGDGTFALDRQLQPVAALSTRILGLARLADTLQQNQAVSASDAESLRKAAHSQPAASMPITIQDGKVWFGTVAVADPPHLSWPHS